MKILSFDIESSTGSPRGASLCSFGYRLEGDGACEGRDIPVNPLPKAFPVGKYVGPKLAYPVAEFRRQPHFDGRYCEIKAVFDRADLVVGFALSNDIKYLNNACDCFKTERIKFSFIDVQVIGGLVVPELKNKGLDKFAERFGVEFNHHRSDEDARVTLEVLYGLIRESGMTLDGIIETYGVVLGENRDDGYTNCYARADIEARLKAGGRSVKKLLANYYVDHVAERVPRTGRALRHKRVCASENVSADLAAFRKLVAVARKEGGYFCQSSYNGCDVYVSDENDKREDRIVRTCRGVSVMTKEEFFSTYGEADCPFDDYAILEGHYSALVPDREPAEAE